MADVLVDFLNHGALPFVGRIAEQERILRFWSERGDEQFSLETLLLTGEAGIGKSRLIEETIPLIESRKGAVVHVKLRPEGSTSLIPLIVLGIERSESARSLFRTLPSDTYNATIGALRRLCALRRTLLVIEDIHLLEGPSLHEFSLLLESLRDESLGLLAATRPIESTAIDILEAYITEDIRLEGLGIEAIEEMWHLLFNDKTPSAMSTMLKETTHGNALALRSALRGGVRIGSLKRQGHQEKLEVQIEPGAFKESARRATRAVVTGMIAGLEADLLENACRLALLGEIFSQQAAAEVVENADEVIASLTFKGILTRTTTSSMPINSDEMNGSPISFTHTLVHDDLLAEAPKSIDRIVRSLGSGGAIYTYLPYRLVAAHTESRSLSAEELAAAIYACSNTARLVNMGSDWRNASVPLRAAKRMMEWLPENFDEKKRAELTAIQLWAELDTKVRREFDDEHKALAERLLEISSTDPDFFDYHLIALEHLMRNATDIGRGDGREIFDQAVAFAERDRRARCSQRYAQFLYVTTTAAHNRNDNTLLRQIEKIVEGILEEELSQADRHNIYLRLLPSFLVLIRSQEEAEKRLRQLETLLPIIRPLSPDIVQGEFVPYFHIQSFYLMTGEIDKLVALGENFLPVLQQHGLLQSYYLTKRWTLLGQCLNGEKNLHDGEPWQVIVQEIMEDEGLSDYEKERLHLSMARNYHNAAYLLGDLSLMDSILEEWNLDLTTMPLANQMIHTLWHRDYEAFVNVAQVLPPDLIPLAAIAAHAAESEEKGLELIEKNIEHLRDRPYDLFQFVRIYIAIEILEGAIQAGTVAVTTELKGRIKSEVHTTLAHCLTLLAERQLPLLMEPIIHRYGTYFSRNERRAWEERIGELTEARRRSDSFTHHGQIIISMFDTITVEIPNKGNERLRGGRSTTLLGLLVANRMLKYPLDRMDFFALASGVEGDPDRARTATNVAVLRLREVIGRETILTGNDLPELNDRLAGVDLLQMWHGLERGEKELHSGHLLNAREAAREAIVLGAGRVPFPGLYDELFERLREDIETRLRTLVLGVAGRLITADDPTGAEELLRFWNARVPEDEESLRLLAEALERSGERAEAVAVRSRGSMVGL